MIRAINQIIVANPTKIPHPMSLKRYLNGTRRSLIVGFLSSNIIKFVFTNHNHNRAPKKPAIANMIAIAIDRGQVG
jgi:hypothetical protein